MARTGGETSSPVWSIWNGAAIYQVYPRSFYEVRQKPEELRGEGSLKGITAKLDYLNQLGANAVWISPFYPSPMVDSGYDIKDYTDVDPRYGNLQDFEELVAEAHERGIRMMIDLVPNHTSDQHPWFQESRLNPSGPKADWYIWRDPEADGSPPNNWASVFSLLQLKARQEGRLEMADDELTPPLSAWTFDSVRGQYYLHSFAEQQPDLNWHNPQVREAIKDVMRFWLDLGVDGFRVDAVNYIGKDPSLADEEPNPDYREGLDNPYDQLKRHHSAGYPDTLFNYLREISAVLDEETYADRDLRIVYEAYMEPPELRRIAAVAPHNSAPFNFTGLDTPWRAADYKAFLDAYHADLEPGWIPNQVLGNHDKPRVASRLGAAARSAAVLTLSLPGMIFIYNGEEGGFTNVEVPPELQDDKLGNRDQARTPMLWTPGKNAGFSKVDPEALWLPIDPNYLSKNLEAQSRDPRSFLSLYKALLALRNGSALLKEGEYQPLFTDNPEVLGFARRHTGDQLTVFINFSEQPANARIWQAQQAIGRVIISSTIDRREPIVQLEDGISLEPNEGIVVVRSA